MSGCDKDLSSLVNKVSNSTSKQFLLIRLKPFGAYLNFRKIPLARDFMDDYNNYIEEFE